MSEINITKENYSIGTDGILEYDLHVDVFIKPPVPVVFLTIPIKFNNVGN